MLTEEGLYGGPGRWSVNFAQEVLSHVLELIVRLITTGLLDRAWRV